TIAREEAPRERGRDPGFETAEARGEPDTGEEPGQFPGGRREHRFVEIVEIEVDETVVPAKAPEVLEVEVARDPCEGRIVEHRVREPILVEEVTGAAEERERAHAHRAVLEGEALRLATAMEGSDPLDDRRGDRGSRGRGHRATRDEWHGLAGDRGVPG